ncbi:class I SAM-dependent methyltransferase [Patulibacter minatonensis]|uniref:class I SAM-dependent methyltransferase n=1 Tax=Patulibacter minatonensis TaxID=298163 RepID=UPI00047E858D|nr:methyltransferase domain-containing protein [Patulibacter minatonensis]
MRPDARQRIDELADDLVVLDVGGWAAPLWRADWVVDLLPYETRGLYGAADPDRERFSADTWVQADICGPDPWPFEDDQFDVVICSHTLEDVRDPVFVCAELQRVSRSGYVELPTAVEELTFGVQGPWVGWSHHRWIGEWDGGELVLTHKPHLLAAPGRHLPTGTHEAVPADDRTIAFWWEDEVRARERVLVDADEFDGWLGGLLAACAAQAGIEAPQPDAPGTASGGRLALRRKGRLRQMRGALGHRASRWRDGRR